MEKTLNDFREIYKDQTIKASTIGRQIVFALFALIWAISYQEGVLEINPQLIISLLILILFLVLDLLQAIIASIKYKKYFTSTDLAISHNQAVDIDGLNKACNKTDLNIFRLFIIKLLTIPVALIGIVIEIIKLL